MDLDPMGPGAPILQIRRIRISYCRVKGDEAVAEREREWRIFRWNREAVVESLEQGECDGILPAARGFLDGFAGFLLDGKILDALDQFPDPRQRRSIPIFFFCNTLVHRPLFHLERLAPIERTLFRSPYILRQLGFNARQVAEGFYDTVEGQKPFTVESIAECFAKASTDDFVANQQQVLKQLLAYCPGQFLEGPWVMDSVQVSVPRGAHTKALSFKVCVLGVWQESVVWPLLWLFVPATTSEVVVGPRLFAAAAEIVGEGAIQHLLIDRGYIDGNWITELYQKGTRVTIGVKEDMLVFEEMKNWRYADDTVWTEVDPPKLSNMPLPKREVTGFTDLQGEWKSCAAPLSGCLIRDTYDDDIVYQGLVTTAPRAEATEILNDNRKRWTLEEVYMTLTRYWRFDNLAPCRRGVAYAQVHFALVAFTLLGFYLQETEEIEDVKTWNQGPPAIPIPERELAVYAGSSFALLRASELLQIILSHVDAWKANEAKLLMALRHCESG
jgi:hypothetical protein